MATDSIRLSQAVGFGGTDAAPDFSVRVVNLPSSSSSSAASSSKPRLDLASLSVSRSDYANDSGRRSVASYAATSPSLSSRSPIGTSGTSSSSSFRLGDISNNTNSADYRKELEKIMSKTKGTAYEAAIKLFFEKKMAEQMAAGEGQKNNKIDLYQLSSSKYDSKIDPAIVNPRGNSHINSSSNNNDNSNNNNNNNNNNNSKGLAECKKEEESRASQQKKRTEALSQPLDWQIWKGPFSGHGKGAFDRISTNHVGRQRPGPPPPPNRAASPGGAALNQSQSSMVSISDNMSLSSVVAEEKIVTSSSYHKQALRFRGRSPGVVSVSLDEFDGWLNNNRNWQEKVAKVVDYNKKKREYDDKTQAYPKINKKSEELSVKAFERELEKSQLCLAVECDNTVTMGPRNSEYSAANLLLEGAKDDKNRHRVDTNNAPMSHGRAWSGGGGGDLIAHNSHNHTDNEDVQTKTIVAGSGITPSVFVRLAVYGNIKAQKIRSSFENRYSSPAKEGTFAPVVNQNASKLAERFQNSTSSRRLSRRSVNSYSNSNSRNNSPTNSSAAYDSPSKSMFNTRGSAVSSINSPTPPPPPPPMSSNRGSSNNNNNNNNNNNIRTLSLNLEDLKIGQSTNNNSNISSSRNNYSNYHDNIDNGINSSRNYQVDVSLSQSNVKSLYVSRRSRSTSRERILEGYEKHQKRSSSAQRMKEVNSGHERLSQKLVTSQKNGVLAPRSEKIINETRKGESFSDRYYKSVDSMLVRRAIGDRAGDPGPGYYSNSPCMDVSIITPIGSTSKAYRNRSPDRGGHSFARTPRKAFTDFGINVVQLDMLNTSNSSKSNTGGSPNSKSNNKNSNNNNHSSNNHSSNNNNNHNSDNSNNSTNEDASRLASHYPALESDNSSSFHPIVTSVPFKNSMGNMFVSTSTTDLYSNTSNNHSSSSGLTSTSATPTSLDWSSQQFQFNQPQPIAAASTPKSAAILRRTSMLITSNKASALGGAGAGRGTSDEGIRYSSSEANF